jgi:hypothetical protein
MDGETVHGFGRDDGTFWVEKTTTARTTARTMAATRTTATANGRWALFKSMGFI